MNVHLSTQHALGQGFLQLRGQGLEIQGSASPTLCNQLIQQLARDAVVVLLCHTFLLSNSSWYGSDTQNSLQAPIFYVRCISTLAKDQLFPRQDQRVTQTS